MLVRLHLVKEAGFPAGWLLEPFAAALEIQSMFLIDHFGNKTKPGIIANYQVKGSVFNSIHTSKSQRLFLDAFDAILEHSHEGMNHLDCRD